MADHSEGLAGGHEGFQQLDRVLVFGEIPHRPMATGIENGIEILLLDAVEAKRRGELCIRGRIGFEPAGQIGLEVRLVTLRIERRLTAFRRGEHDLGARVLEHKYGAASSSSQKPVLRPVLPSSS